MDFFHHVGLHVNVNLEGKTVGGTFFNAETWLPGVIVGVGALGDSLTVKLDQPVGGGETGRLLHRTAAGQDLVSVQPEQLRERDLSEVAPAGIPDEIVQLVRAGKTVQAIKKYRDLNGATVDEARAALQNL